MSIEARERRLKALRELGTTADEQRRAKARKRYAKEKHLCRSVGTAIRCECQSHKRRAMYSSCSKKARYKNQSAARRAANLAFTRRGVKLHCYLCPFCGGFHLTKAGEGSTRKDRVF